MIYFTKKKKIIWAVAILKVTRFFKNFLNSVLNSVSFDCNQHVFNIFRCSVWWRLKSFFMSFAYWIIPEILNHSNNFHKHKMKSETNSLWMRLQSAIWLIQPIQKCSPICSKIPSDWPWFKLVTNQLFLVIFKMAWLYQMFARKEPVGQETSVIQFA